MPRDGSLLVLGIEEFEETLGHFGRLRQFTNRERMANKQRIGSQGKRYIFGTNLIVSMVVHDIECADE